MYVERGALSACIKVNVRPAKLSLTGKCAGRILEEGRGVNGSTEARAITLRLHYIAWLFLNDPFSTAATKWLIHL